mmetsp:Transcript_67538/g.147132  ORF Transcript_67538/g.147132 Transcript_67538/m.147132 type:complete len:485 (-) Transcript_67538:263-1717(-)
MQTLSGAGCWQRPRMASTGATGSLKLAHGIRLLEVVVHKRADRLPQEHHIPDGVVALNSLVEVRVEGNLLHVLKLAEVYEALPCWVGRVEELLQGIQNQVCWPILCIPLPDILFQVSLINHPSATLGGLDDLLCAHATALGGEVDALPRALGDVACGITNEGGTALRAPWARVLRDGVRLNPDDLTSRNARCGAVTDALLIFLDTLLVHNGASANGHVVILGEDPCVEVGRDVIANVHLCTLLVVFHFVLRDPHALLESNSILVAAGFDVLGHAAVGSICADHDVHLQGLLSACPRLTFVIAEVVVREDVGLIVRLGKRHGHEESVNDLCAILSCPLPQVGVQDLAANHANVLIVCQCLSDLNLLVGRGDHGHLPDAPVDQLRGKVKLPNHAEGNGATARLAVVQLALDEIGLDPCTSKSVRTACSTGAATYNCHSKLATLGQLGTCADDSLRAPQGPLLLLRHRPDRCLRHGLASHAMGSTTR